MEKEVFLRSLVSLGKNPDLLPLSSDGRVGPNPCLVGPALTHYPLGALGSCCPSPASPQRCLPLSGTSDANPAVSEDALFRDKLKHMGKCESSLCPLPVSSKTSPVASQEGGSQLEF